MSVNKAVGEENCFLDSRNVCCYLENHILMLLVSILSVLSFCATLNCCFCPSFCLITWHCWKYWSARGTGWPAWPFWNNYQFSELPGAFCKPRINSKALSGKLLVDQNYEIFNLAIIALQRLIANWFCQLQMLPARNNFWFDKKTDPTDDHKHEAWQINLDHELHLFSLDPHLKATWCIGSWGTKGD